MKLDSFDGQAAVAYAHDDAVFGLGSYFESGRQFVWKRVERMVAADGKLFREPCEDACIAMADAGWLSVHRISEDSEFAAKSFDDALKAEANAEHGQATPDGGQH